MKYGLTFGAIVLVLLVVFYPEKEVDNISYSEVVESLKKSLGQYPPDSKEAKEIAGTLRQARAKNNKLPTEDPAAFMRALAEIKTDQDGNTYQKNYKTREVKKAKDRATTFPLRTKSLPWISRGPVNVSGRARSIAVDPKDSSGNTWFVPTVGGGVWKTTDGGDTWQLKTAELPTMSVSSIAISPSNPDVIYIGTGMGYGRVVDLEGSGIWKSTDHGESWNQLPSENLFDAINRIIIDPTDENVVVLCANNSYTSTGPNGGDRASGIFRSINGGETWVQVFDPTVAFGNGTDNRVQHVLAKPGDFNIMYATVNEVGVVKSTDGGVNWIVSADNFAIPEDIGFGEGTYSGVSTRIEMAISPSNPKKLYASVERPRGSAALYMSPDEGENWTFVPAEGDEINWHSAFGTSGAEGAYTSGWFNNTIVVHPYDEDIVYVGGVNLFRIDINANANTHYVQYASLWYAPNNFNLPTTHGDNHLLTVIPDDNGTTFRIICPNDGGVAYSPANGTSWVQKSGMISTQFYGVDKKPGEDIYIGGTQDNGTWLSGSTPSEDWTHVIGGDGFEAAWNVKDPNQLLGSSQGGRIYKSRDGGANWEPLTDARPSIGPFITKIANSRSDTDLAFVVTRDGVSRTDDFGETWTETRISPWIGYRPFSSVKISDANPQIVWAASRISNDPFGNSGGVHVSNDGGNTFVDISANLPPSVEEASGLATDPLDPQIAYLLFSAPGVPKILKTHDLGESWEDISGFEIVARTSSTGFPDVAVFSLLVMPYDTEIIWAGTEIGLFISEDGGQSWTIAPDFPPVSVFDLKVRDEEVIIATYGRGIWTTNIDDLENFEPKIVTLAPRLKSLSFLPLGEIQLVANYRSDYDSSHVILNEDIAVRTYNNAANTDTTMYIPISESATLNAFVISYLHGDGYYSSVKKVNVNPTVPQDSYINLVNSASATADFDGELFDSSLDDDFTGFAFHSPHPYPQSTELTFQLTIPIVVNSEYPFLEYKDVLLVEEGNVDNWQDANFFDYVVVEGTSNGQDWLALAPGYDSRYDSNWSAAYKQGSEGTEAMFVQHKINLTDVFEPGETIFIRFRLYSDALATGWGWAVDNIIIQEQTITGLESAKEELIKIFPNPVGDVLHIQNDSRIQQVAIISNSGQVLLEKSIHGQSHQLDVNHLKKGIYFLRYRKENDSFRSIRFVKE